jgi:mono/diheme cytochrome c family protein
MKRRLVLWITVVSLSVGLLPLMAAVTTAQRKELNALKSDVGKIPSLLRKKQVQEAEQALDEAEAKLNEFIKTEAIGESEPLVRSLRQLIDKQKQAIARSGGKVNEVSFTDVIAPILQEKCVGCHGDNPKGGLRLDTFAGLERGGGNGPLVFVGKPEQSLLMARLTTPNAQRRMPKGGEALSAEEVKKFAEWISAGAKFDATDKNARLDRLEKPKPPVEVARPTGNEKVSFLKDVAPGFVDFCLRCHNANNRQGGFSMATFEKLMQGGDSGTVIAPGNLEESRLWTLIDEGEMPRGAQARITRKWYADLKTWILEGCKYDHNETRADLARLVPTEEERRLAELAKLSPEEFARRRLQTSQEQWTRTFPNGKPEQVASEEFYLFGDVPADRLQEINGWAEEQLKSLRAMFNAKEEPLFRGKLTIFVFKERFGYEEFNATIDRRDVPREVVGHSRVTPEEAYVALLDVGDDESDDSPAMRLNLMEHLAGAFLRRDAKEALPDWLIRGTGLALGAKLDLGGAYLGKLRRSAGSVLIAARLERPEQIFEGGTFSPSDVAPVGLTVVEFLLKQGGGAKFGQFVKRVQNGEKVDEALQAVYGAPPRALAAAYAALHATGAATRKPKK